MRRPRVAINSIELLDDDDDDDDGERGPDASVAPGQGGCVGGGRKEISVQGRVELGSSCLRGTFPTLCRHCRIVIVMPLFQV